MDEIIYISVIDSESKKIQDNRIHEGIQKTAGILDMPIDVISGMVKVSLNKKNDKGQNKLNELLEHTNKTIGQIANSLSQSMGDVPNLAEMDIEFGIGFTEGLKLGIFGIGSQQSLKVKIKLQKEQH